MNAPVDVLAVLDLALKHARTDLSVERFVEDDLIDARAAVAELIAAVPALIDIVEGAPVSLGAIRRVKAALARVGGAA